MDTSDETLGLRWQKSSRSGCDCVEVARIPDGVAVRDSKHVSGGALAVGDADWRAFLTGIRAGTFHAA